MTRFGLLPLAAVVLAAAAQPVAAQQADEPSTLQKVLGAIGLLELPQDPIVYREREPLVVPPTTALIAPRDPADIRRINPDWPVDYDERKRRALDPEEIRRQDEVFYSGRPLTPAELDKARISRQEAARRQAARRGPTAGEERVLGQEIYNPSQLGFRGWGAKQEPPTVYPGEPARTSLIMPPSEYFRPSDKAPYGVVTQTAPRAKAPTLFERVGAQGDPATRQ